MVLGISNDGTTGVVGAEFHVEYLKGPVESSNPRESIHWIQLADSSYYVRTDKPDERQCSIDSLHWAQTPYYE